MILICIITLLLFFILKTITQSQNIPLSSLFSISTTTVLLSIFYFIYLILKIPFLPFCILFISLLLIISSYLILKKKITPFNIQINYIDSLFLLFVIYAIVKKNDFTAIWGHYGQWDAWAIWTLHAKFLFYENNWVQYLCNDLSWTHPDYPLYLSSLIALFWKAQNQISPIEPYLISLLPLLGILYILFYSINSTYLKAMACCLLLLSPVYLEYSCWQYADVPLAFFYLLTIAYIYKTNKPFRTESPIQYFYIGLVASFGIWVKNEGQIFFIITIAILIIFNKFSITKVASLILGSISMLIVLYFYKFSFTPQNDMIAGQSLDSFTKFITPSRYYTIFSAFGKITYDKFPLLFLMIPFIILNYKKSAVHFKASLIITTTLLCYLSIYIITPNELVSHLFSSLDRLLIQLYPCFLFVSIKLLERKSKY